MDIYIRDISLGFIDSITVIQALALGLTVGSKFTIDKKILILAIISEIIAGSVSMGMSEYLSIDTETIKNKDENPIYSGLRVSLGYSLGGLITLMCFLLSNDLKKGLILSLILNNLFILLFGYIRGKVLNLDIKQSITKTYIIGLSALIIVYTITSYFN